MYTIKLLSNEEYDSLPYRRAKNSLGCADPKTKIAYVRKTGIDLLDLGTIYHEIDELVAKISPHEIDGIRYKGKSEPQYNPPPAPVLPTAAQLLPSATTWAQSNYPLAYGAREGALTDINNPAYYAGFQPTSFEQALGDQYFQNVWPDTEREILQKLSMTGMEYSPITAATTGKAKGDLMTTIGEYLSNLGQTRAQYSLQSRLGIDPYNVYSPYLETDIGQSNKQAAYNYQAAMAKAQADYDNAMAEYKQKQAGISSAFGMGGAGIGGLLALLAAIPTGGLSLAALPAILGAAGAGAGLGSSIGGYAAPLFGGSSGGGMGMQDALALLPYFSGGIGKAIPVGGSSGGFGSNLENTMFNKLGGQSLGSSLNWM